MQLLHARLMQDDDSAGGGGTGDRHAVEAFDFMGSFSEAESSSDEDLYHFSGQ
jgi:hypothetical protein